MEQDSIPNSRLLSTGVRAVGLITAGTMIADVIIPASTVRLAMVPAYCMAAFVVLHSITFLGVRRAMWFLAAATILPFTAIFVGANFVTPGSKWLVPAMEPLGNAGPMLPGQVPLSGVVTWFGLLYLVFTSAVYLLKAKTSDPGAFAFVPMLGALLVLLWQLSAAPAAAGRAMATQAEAGFFQNVPSTAFLGWFAVALFIILFFEVVEPGSVDAGRFAEPGHRLAALGPVMYGASLLHASATCLKTNATGAGWLGIVVFLSFALAAAVRGTTFGQTGQLHTATSS